MLWKAVFIACLASVALADEYEAQKAVLRSHLEKECTKNGAPKEKVAEVEAAAKTFMDCIKGMFNPEEIKKEIEEAKPNGALDEVFGKYCAKTPELKTCLSTLTTSFTPCLDPAVREQVDTLKGTVDQLLDFVCHKNGDRIALFIAEGGPECFKDKADGIKQCLDKQKETVSSLEQFKALTLVDKCKKFDSLSECVVQALEQCAAPTPGNMAESLFKYVRKNSPCNTALPKKDD